MQPARMQLENYFVEDLSFQVQQNYKFDPQNPPKLEPTDLEIEVRLGDVKNDAFRKICHLVVTLKEALENPVPYSFRLVMVGFFKMDAACDEKEIEILLKNTAPSILFTAGREILMMVTGRARFQSLMLPTMAFFPKLSSNELESVTQTKKRTLAKVSKKSSKKV
jgi:preprotein translocase subunit SecB